MRALLPCNRRRWFRQTSNDGIVRNPGVVGGGAKVRPVRLFFLFPFRIFSLRMEAERRSLLNDWRARLTRTPGGMQTAKVLCRCIHFLYVYFCSIHNYAYRCMRVLSVPECQIPEQQKQPWRSSIPQDQTGSRMAHLTPKHQLKSTIFSWIHIAEDKQ